jgi:2-dehydropantoate 2-reductase
MSAGGEPGGDSPSPAPAIAIVGAGSLGQAMAALLAQAGSDVALVATPRTAAELRAAGEIRLEGAVEAAVPVAAALGTPGAVAVGEALPAVVEPLGLLFATKAHQLAPAIATLAAPRERVAWAAGLQNGVVKDDLLAAAYGAERVLGAATIMGAQRIENGRVRVTAPGTTFLGEFDGPPSPRVAALAATLSAAGIPARTLPDVRSVIWSKACNATGAFGVWMLVGPDAPLVGYDPDLMRALLGLVRETAAIARSEGVEVGDHDGLPPVRSWAQRPVEETLAALPPVPVETGPRAFPSMLQDRLAGRPLEVEEVFGDLVARAERNGVEAPRLSFTRDLLRGIARGVAAAG